MLTTIAAIIMCIIFYKLGAITVLASVLLLAIKSIIAIFLMVAGFFGWRCYRNRKPKQLEGNIYEHHN